MGETRKRGVLATAEGIVMLTNAKALGGNRDTKRWTYASIADAGEISDKTVRRFFNRVPIDKDIAIVICKTLGVDDSLVLEKETTFEDEDKQGQLTNDLVKNNHSPDRPVTAVKYIPYRGARHFVGRDRELATIHENLHSQNIVAISAITGMGGAGKTELAARYARQHENDYPGGICWLTVRDSDLAAGIIQFVQSRLSLEVPQKGFQGNLLTLTEQVSWCWQNWQPQSGLVLLVFDDVTNIDSFNDYLPIDSRFHVLITTRLRNLGINIEEIFLDMLSSNEALQLLKEIIGSSKVNKEPETAEELCTWLGHLPLAIELVGWYIKNKFTDFTLFKMLDSLKQKRLQQEALNPKQISKLNTAQLGVLAAFELSWSKLDPTTQQVATLLSLFAIEIFDWEMVKSTFKYLNWDESDVDKSVDELSKCHLLQCLESENKYYYKIHPLIREFLQEKLTVDEKINDFKQALTNGLIELSEPIIDATRVDLVVSFKNTIPHLIEIAEKQIEAISYESSSRIYRILGCFYTKQGLYAFAEPWAKKSTSLLQSHLREEHPGFVESLNNLASLKTEQGKFDLAERDRLATLDLRELLNGKSLPEYTNSLSRLAGIYCEREKHSEAEHLYLQALELNKIIVGESNIGYAVDLNNLAYFYHRQGKYDRAEPLYQQALKIVESSLGGNNLIYATSLNNSGGLDDDRGEFDKSEPLYIQLLELIKTIYATSLNNLGGLYGEQGKSDKAEPLYIQALELRKRILKEDHPDYAESLNNLAGLCTKQGKHDKAEPMYIQALDIYERILGEGHPRYAISLSNLANCYQSQRKYDLVEPLYKQALELYKRTLGEDNCNYAAILSNLADFYCLQGDYERAEDMNEQALELKKRILGEDHPDYAVSLHNLGFTKSSQGQYDEAESLYKQALTIAIASLGENHPTTIIFHKNLGLLLNRDH